MVIFLFAMFSVLFAASSQKAHAEDQACVGPRLYKTDGTKVPGGWSACSRYWPGIAALRYFNPVTEESIYFCGGVMINSQWMMTAAHCFNNIDKGQNPSINLGITFRSLDLTGTGNIQVVVGTSLLDQARKIYDVKEIRKNPDYVHGRQSILNRNPNACDGNKCVAKVGFDMALVRIDGKYDGPFARIAARKDDDPPDGLRIPVMVAGFGRTEAGHFKTELKIFTAKNGSRFRALTNVLQETSIPMVPRSVCKERYTSRYRGVIIGEKQLCAADENLPGRGTCAGDSGGPLVAYDTKRCPYVVGLTSWGVGCGGSHKGNYGIYSRVSQFVPWLVKEGIPFTALTKQRRFNRKAWNDALKLGTALAKLSTSPQRDPLQINFCASGNPRECGERLSAPMARVPNLALKIRSKAKNKSDAAKPSHLVVFILRADGKLIQLFPRRRQKNKIQPGRTITLPNKRGVVTGYPIHWDMHKAKLFVARLSSSAFEKIHPMIKAAAKPVTVPSSKFMICKKDGTEKEYKRKARFTYRAQKPSKYMRAILKALKEPGSALMHYELSVLQYGR